MKKFLSWRALIGLLIALVALPLIVRNAEWRALDDASRTGATGAYVQLSEGQVHYEMAGPDSAPPVVLVHGFSVPSYIFDPTFAALAAAGHRVIRFDLYGRGTSARPRGDYDIHRVTRQVDELLSALRGATSDVLSPATFDRMVREKPDLEPVTVPGRGHAPTLEEPECVAAIDAFLRRCG